MNNIGFYLILKQKLDLTPEWIGTAKSARNSIFWGGHIHIYQVKSSTQVIHGVSRCTHHTGPPGWLHIAIPRGQVSCFFFLKKNKKWVTMYAPQTSLIQVHAVSKLP